VTPPRAHEPPRAGVAADGLLLLRKVLARLILDWALTQNHREGTSPLLSVPREGARGRVSPRGELSNRVLRGLKQVSGLCLEGHLRARRDHMALPSDWTSADLWVLLQAPSTCFVAPTLAGCFRSCTCPGQCKHSPRVHAHRPGTMTSLKDSKLPPILLPLETLSIMITSPLFLGPPLARPRLPILDTLHETSDTHSCGGRFLWAPELALRAVEEGPEGQVNSLTAGTRVSSCPCPLCFTLRSRDSPAGSHSSLTLLPGSMLQRFTRPGHLPAQYPEQGDPSTCHLQIAYSNCPGREGRTSRDPASQRPSRAGCLDKHSGPEGHSASRSQPWPAPPRPHAGVTDWALPQGPTRVLEALQGQ
jgi:hypothetical protein